MEDKKQFSHVMPNTEENVGLVTRVLRTPNYYQLAAEVGLEVLFDEGEPGNLDDFLAYLKENPFTVLKVTVEAKTFMP